MKQINKRIIKKTSDTFRYRRQGRPSESSFNIFVTSATRGERWEKVGNWTQGEKKGTGLWGVRILAVTATGGPVKIT
eukprot:6514135-Pyramimonas_sp.AAC.1